MASFLQEWLRFRMIPTSSGSHSKPHFFHYIKPYIVHFQEDTENSKEKPKID